MYQLMFQNGSINWEVVSGIICLMYLFILSGQDIISRTVSVWLLISGIIAAVFYQFLVCEEALFLCAAGAVIGIAFIGVSKVTKEGIGYGDSILILVLGIYLGLWDLLYMLMIAFSLSAIFSTIILAASHYNRKKTFPFIPFLAVGDLILFLWKYIL